MRFKKALLVLTLRLLLTMMEVDYETRNKTIALLNHMSSHRWFHVGSGAC